MSSSSSDSLEHAWSATESLIPGRPDITLSREERKEAERRRARSAAHDWSHTIQPLPESDFNPQRQEAVKNGGSSKPSVTSYSSAGLGESMDGRKRRREGWFDRDDRLMNGGEDKRNAKNRAAQKYGPNNAVCEPRCNCGRCVFNHLGSAGTHDDAVNNRNAECENLSQVERNGWCSLTPTRPAPVAKTTAEK